MPKFIITWDGGYGDVSEVVEAENLDKAVDIAYEQWKEEVESNANYGAEPYTEDRAEDLGL